MSCIVLIMCSHKNIYTWHQDCVDYMRHPCAKMVKQCEDDLIKKISLVLLRSCKLMAYPWGHPMFTFWNPNWDSYLLKFNWPLGRFWSSTFDKKCYISLQNDLIELNFVGATNNLNGDTDGWWLGSCHNCPRQFFVFLQSIQALPKYVLNVDIRNVWLRQSQWTNLKLCLV